MQQNINELSATVNAKNDFPDWNSGISGSWGTTYTAIKNGWVYARSHTRLGTTSLYINGKEFVIASSTKEETAAGSSVFIPVSKNDTYRIGGGGSENHTLIFYPCKGE